MTFNDHTLVAIAPLLLLLFGLSITVVIDPYIRREHRRVMLIIAEPVLKNKKKSIVYCKIAQYRL